MKTFKMLIHCKWYLLFLEVVKMSLFTRYNNLTWNVLRQFFWMLFALVNSFVICFVKCFIFWSSWLILRSRAQGDDSSVGSLLGLPHSHVTVANCFMAPGAIESFRTFAGVCWCADAAILTAKVAGSIPAVYATKPVEARALVRSNTRSPILAFSVT